MKRKDVEYIVAKERIRRRSPFEPVFVFLMSAFFTALVISSVQYIGGERGSSNNSEVLIVDGVETVVPDFVGLETVSEGHKLEDAGVSEIPGVSGKRTVYLTFDDGPGSFTAKLLDVLAKYNVKATFFVTCRGDDNLILREFNEGHTVALHTCSHNYEIYRSVESYFSDLFSVSERVLRITGVRSNIIRFPGGSSNAVSTKYKKGIMTTLTQEVEAKGYKYFDWNVSSGDASNSVTTADGVFQTTINAINGRGEGSFSVVLQHDVKGFSVDAVERIIQYGLENGYEFKKLDENSPVVHHKVNN